MSALFLDTPSNAPSSRASGLSEAERLVLRRIVARAASPEERTRHPAFAPVRAQDPVLSAVRERAWVAAIGDGDVGRLGLWLDILGIAPEDFRSGLRDVDVVEGIPLPEWATTLERLLREMAEGEPGREIGQDGWDTMSPILQPILPFMAIGSRALREAAESRGADVTPEAARQILEGLFRRLVNTCMQVLDAELQFASVAWRLASPPEREPQLDRSMRGWLSRFERYPVLGRLVAVVFGHWRAHVTEIFERFAADREDLAEHFFSGRPPGRLVGFSGDAGDLHDHGRSVAILTFEGNRRLVYKPKDLRIARVLLDLIRDLNPHLPLSLHVRKLLLRDDYAWDEFVPFVPCTTVDEGARFYRRMGMLVRLFQFLGARDFWLDNLIAHRDQPVFIDLEMAVQHRNDDGGSLLPAEQACLNFLEESVIKLGIIAYCMPVGIGVRAEDLGAMTPVRRMSSPFQLSPESERNLGGALHVDGSRHVQWDKTDYAPHLGAEPIPATAHFQEVLAGYRDMQACLAARRESLLAADGGLSLFDGCQLRFIHRDTWTCMSIIQESLRPQALLGGVEREILLSGIFRDALRESPARPGEIRLNAAEVRAFSDLDVPLFGSRSDGQTVCSEGGLDATGFFRSSAATNLRRRAQELGEFDTEGHCEVARSLFSTGFHPPPAVPLPASAPSVMPSKDELLDVAVSIGDFIWEQAFVSEQGDAAWLGLVHHPHMASSVLEVLRPDLLTGTCGLAVLFADLHQATGEQRFKHAALAAIASTVRIAEEAPGLFARQAGIEGSSRRPLYLGAHYGIGSQIFALKYCGEVLGESALVRTAEGFATHLPPTMLCRQASDDWVTGAPGLCVALLAEAPPCSTFHAKAAEVLAILTAPEFEYRFSLPSGDHGLLGLPGTVGGRRLMIHRARMAGISHAATGSPSRPAPGHRDTVGDTLVDLEMEGTMGPGTVPEWLRPDPATLSSAGLLDRMAIGLADPGGDSGCVAAKAAAVLLDRKARHHGWFPDRWAADRHQPSILTGIGAISHSFLRLARPGHGVCPRLLRPGLRQGRLPESDPTPADSSR